MEGQVIQCLQATLEPDHTVRTQAEDQLRQLFSHPQGGLTLAKLLTSQQVELYQRQMRLLLQKYVDKHWSPVSANFEAPATPIEVKGEIRDLVFGGLSDGEGKIRTASAYSLSAIARFDWPEDYPTLLPSLIQLLNNGSPTSIHGSMRVIQDFVRNDLSEDQLLPVVQELLPAVLGILGNPASHSPTTRASTVHVFRQVLRMLETIREEHPEAAKSAIDSLSAVWLDAFKQLLAQDAATEIQANWTSINVRVEIFRTLSLYQNAFKTLIAPHIPELIQLALHNLQSLLPLFRAFYLSSEDDAPEPPSPTSDVGMMEDKTGLPELTSAIFDLLTPVVRTKSALLSLISGSEGSEAPTEVLEQLVKVVQEWTQVTKENTEEWMEDPNAFVVDEDDDNEQYSVRTCGYDLVGSLIDKWTRPVASVLQKIVEEKVQDAASAKQSGSIDWWKPLESVLALIGGIADDVRDMLEEDQEEKRPPAINIGFLFDNVIPGLLGQNETPFLQGRAFVFASQFSSMLNQQLAGQYLSAAVQVLEASDVSVPVKISAVKTIKNFCRHVDPFVLKPFSTKTLHLILPLLPQASSETLYLVLETLRAITSMDDDLLDEQTTRTVVDVLFDVWLRCTNASSDPVTTAIIEENIESISLHPNPSVVSILITALSPKLAATISSPVTDETVHIPGEAVQLANSLLRVRGGPLEGELVATVTRSVVEVLRVTDDMDVIQHGMIHLTLVVRKDCEKLVQWHDAQGQNGINAIFALLARFLAPEFSESGGIFVGELIMHLFRKAGEAIGPVLPDLLRAVVERLKYAKMASFIQTLVLPFAYLFSTEYTSTTIDLLSQMSITPPSESTTAFPTLSAPRSALDIVLNAWSETSETVSGSWNIRVSDMGLSKLFVLGGDQRLREVMVKGDLIVDETNRDTIMTRSRTKAHPNQYTQTPFPLKALKLILKDVQSETSGKGKGKGKGKTVDLEIPEDDGDEDWDDDDDLFGGDDEFEFLSSWLEAGGGNENDAQDDDEDLKSDPLAQIDLGQHLTDVLRHAYSSNANGMHEMVEGLTDEEKSILRGVLTL
ncbi:hypothetical protein L198_06924 [Cryptococcus wingfieldii CBS 7118]|uniref:Importin N-terminal domain-containing protein n=1 Tax=Cryptococcus wingfieldii CBS 7118 TaxID=1295528 RepID=A0A1E3IGP1_9TREE|nr:hypothetical protein L198_06924 [Cryptococcus wingfieldii CBS 7118]ODN87698.1 hypothetical protein L198_06924 [Cryptococcus wingfieldii CBS 7118]